MLNSVVKISIISAKYFEYYTIILRGGAVFCGHTCTTKYTIENDLTKKRKRKKQTYIQTNGT